MRALRWINPRGTLAGPLKEPSREERPQTGGHLMELLSRMMDGSISYDPQDRLEPVQSGAGDRQADKIDFEGIPMLEGCSKKQLRRIARIARVLHTGAGAVLVRRGEPGEEFFLILDGTVSVHVSSEKSVPLGPGAFFGEMSLL